MLTPKGMLTLAKELWRHSHFTPNFTLCHTLDLLRMSAKEYSKTSLF